MNNPTNPTPEYCVCISMSKLENLITITELYVEEGISRINDGWLGYSGPYQQGTDLTKIFNRPSRYLCLEIPLFDIHCKIVYDCWSL